MMRYIIFDVGNVVIKGNQEITTQRLVKLGVLKENAETFYCNKEYIKFSKGLITGREFYRALIQKHLKKNLTYKQVVDSHNNHIYDIDKKLLKLISKFPKKKIVFLTDTNIWQTKREKELVDLRLYSNKIFRSHIINKLKSEKDCFPYVIKKLKIKPEEAVMIDDTLEKIVMAKRCGLNGILYKNASKLEKDLKKMKLL